MRRFLHLAQVVRRCLKYSLDLNVNVNNRAIMKNKAIVIVLLLMAGFVGYGQSPRYGTR